MGSNFWSPKKAAALLLENYDARSLRLPRKRTRRIRAAEAAKAPLGRLGKRRKTTPVKLAMASAADASRARIGPTMILIDKPSTNVTKPATKRVVERPSRLENGIKIAPNTISPSAAPKAQVRC